MHFKKFVVVDTQYGPVKGVRKESVLGRNFLSFQKIPYMKAPVGKLRFRAPTPPEKWNEPLDATQEGPAFCAFDYITLQVAGALDAMHINVFTSDVSPKKPRPVMAFIHGGGFVTGSSRSEFYSPDFLMQKDIVLVSFNYRLDAFGFLSLEDPSLQVPGNAGLKDQTMALKWIKNNIHNFGGDPNNITVFGESAGGASVHYHTISEHSKGLFHKAIPMSGSALNKIWACYPKRNWAERLAKLVGWSGSGGEKELLKVLEEADPYKVIECCDKVLTDEEKYEMNFLFAFGPTVEPYVTENCFIPKDPVLMAQEAWGNEIDMMIGGCSNEGIFILFHQATQNLKLDIFLKNFCYALPPELNVSFGSEKSKEHAKVLKELYYGCTEPSKRNLQGYLSWNSDVMFWHGIQRAILARTNSKGAGKTFVYRFDVVGQLNLFKNLDAGSTKFPGSAHADDLGYLFKTIVTPDVGFSSKDFEAVKEMLNIYTNFASFGCPDPENSWNWAPFKSTSLPLTGLNISDESKVIVLPENERMALWNAIYEKENCSVFSAKGKL